MRYLLDTNIVSNLIRNPHGRVADRIRAIGEQNICTSIIVAAELRYGTTNKASPRLHAQVEAVLGPGGHPKSPTRGRVKIPHLDAVNWRRSALS